MVKKIILYYVGALVATLFLAGFIGGVGNAIGLKETTVGLLVLMGAQLGPVISVLIMLTIFKQEDISFSFKINKFKFFLLSIIIPVVLISLSAGVMVLIGKPYIESDIKGSLFIIFMITSLIGCFGEEIGWRGYLLPLLRKKYSMFISSVLTGLLWGAWHVTKIISYGVLPYLFFILFIAEFGIIMGWIYFRTKHSLTCMVAFHLCINIVCGLLLTGREGISFYVIGILLSLVVILVIWIVDKEFFRESNCYESVYFI
ncbi:MAG: lysostaphin resistance A-like protein [Velocimicrobium sp.]